MASEMARLRGESDRNVYFPFAESAEHFDKAIKSKNSIKQGKMPSRLPLRALHDLDIRTSTRLSSRLHGDRQTGPRSERPINAGQVKDDGLSTPQSNTGNTSSFNPLRTTS
jgi:hypothetical protein